MNTLNTLWGREPAMIVAFVQAVIVLAITFGLELTDEQVGAIVTVVALGLGIITRSQVTPVSQLKARPATTSDRPL